MSIISFKNVLKVFICLAAIFPVSSAFAATYYVDAAAANDYGAGASSSPKKYITSGIKLMSSGDTLILKNGVYTGTNNMIGAASSVYPPDGTSANHTVIKAENVGGAIIDGSYTSHPFSSINRSAGTNYLTLDGIHFRRGKSGVFALYGHHSKVLNCGFEDGMPASSNSEIPIALIAGGSNHVLVEDCWVWGRGRYGLYTSSSGPLGNAKTHKIIFRRVVVRLDSTPAGWVTGGFRFYNSYDNTAENCIVIDSLNNSPSYMYAYASGGGSSTSEYNHLWTGSMAINNPNFHGLSPEDISGAETWTNGIIWGSLWGLYSPSNTVGGTLTLSNSTFGANKGITIRHNGSYPFKANLSNSLLSVPDTAFNYPSSISNTSVYLASGASLGGNPGGSNSISQATLNAGLKYLPRVEKGSALAAAGVGANILYQIGVKGSLYGEAGWKDTTTNQLWPYPNERIWANKLASYTSSGPGGKRGFAALSSATPLTDYIWGYLGNPKPDIYGTGVAADTAAPTASITGPAAGASVTGTVSVTASASDNVGVSKLEFYVNGALKATDAATPYLYSWDTSVLAAGTYTLMAKAYDAANNVGQSSNVSVSVAKDTTAPTASITSPINAATVSGTITVTAGATDTMGVTKIELYGNGVLLTAGNVSPLSYSWNTTAAANGSYTLTAKAYDAAGNVGQASSVVNVSNAPSGTLPSGTVSIWPATATPGVVDNGPDSAVELGVKFRSDVNGYITGLRFYKASTNTGTHVGNLWSSTGTRLATATFAKETASGWQTVSFPTPVAITANTVYVVSYHTSAGHYSNDQKYFSGKGMDNGSLHALADGVSGSNGVYRYGSTSGFPSSSWNAANYWVDPLMTTTLPETAPPTSVAETASIWPATATPGVVDNGPDSAVELGVKFRSDVNGYITGLRFYKASTNTGTHVGNLWSSTGTRLATATFTNETASGWQKVSFATPVAIAANTVYVVSYHTTTGHYSNDQKYFSGKGMDNGTLHALADGVSGSNGVYRYGSTSGFPSSSWNASNYWVDPLMTTTPPTSEALSIWPATATPGVADSGPDSAVELGVKFRSDVNGYITGLRFYKASTNTGTHVGNLWSSTGTRLATATFTNETASGWQKVSFATPVAISANTVYIVSYHTSAGHYSNDQKYFSGKGMDNGTLHALADGVSGSNGVYRYGSTSGFPSSSWNASNYWVDPIMTK